MAASRRAVGDRLTSTSSASTIICRCQTGRLATAASTQRTGSRPRRPAPGRPRPTTMSGLGLSGAPTLYSLPYLKANIEGGEKFNWFYDDGNNDGRGLDPNGSDLVVSLPEGDRLAQTRSPYFAGQQSLANKQLRWWWNNPHQAIYDDWRRLGLGAAWAGDRHGRRSRSRSAFIEYGFPACDKGTNQPNVFFDPKSSASATPYWSIWQPIPGGGFAPQRDDTLATSRCRRSMNTGTSTVATRPRRPASRWSTSPSPASGTGTRGRSRPFRCSASQWGDAGDWAGRQLAQRPRPRAAAGRAFAGADAGSLRELPDAGDARLVDACAAALRHRRRRPRLGPRDAAGALRRRALRRRADLRRCCAPIRSTLELQAIAGFFAEVGGAATPFWLAPPGLAEVSRADPRRRRRRDDHIRAVRRRSAPMSEPVAGTSGVSAVYLNGAALPSSAWSLAGGYAPAIAFAAAPAAGRRRLGRLRRPVALPLFRRRARSRGVHGDAVRARVGEAANGGAMTTPPLFPTLSGQGWSVHKKPIFATIVAPHVSGREVRDRALRQSDLAIRAHLRRARLRRDELSRPRRAILAEPDGPVPAMPGAMGNVSLRRPDRLRGRRPDARERRRRDDELHLRARARRLCRTGRLGDEHFAGDGRRRRAGLGLVARRAQRLVFASAPASGAAIAATFAYAFQCRFDDDAADFEQFMQNLWALESLKFRIVRTN